MRFVERRVGMCMLAVMIGEGESWMLIGGSFAGRKQRPVRRSTISVVVITYHAMYQEKITLTLQGHVLLLTRSWAPRPSQEEFTFRFKALCILHSADAT